MFLDEEATYGEDDGSRPCVGAGTGWGSELEDPVALLLQQLPMVIVDVWVGAHDWTRISG